MPEPTIIKRYANRKLYDTRASRYVTLEEIEELIRQGQEVKVVDADTGDDLTTLTLAQILLESERNRRGYLPAAFLHQLVKHGGALQDFFQKSLQASLQGFIASQREADRIFREWASRAGWMTSSPPTRPQGGEESMPKAEPPSGADEETLREEVKRLKRQLQALEEKVEGKKKRK